MTVTLERAVAAVRDRRASLVAESAGYLVLAAADQIQSAPRAIGTCEIVLTPEGNLRSTGGLVATGGEAVRALRALLGSLLAVARGGTANLARVAGASDACSELSDFILELEAALIPVNRAAARRALSRLYRETARALPVLPAPVSEPLELLPPPVMLVAPTARPVARAEGPPVGAAGPPGADVAELEVPIDVTFEASSEPEHAPPVDVETAPLLLATPASPLEAQAPDPSPPSMPRAQPESPRSPKLTPLFASPVLVIGEPEAEHESLRQPAGLVELPTEREPTPAPEATLRLESLGTAAPALLVLGEARTAEPSEAPSAPRPAEIGSDEPSPPRTVSGVAELLQRFVDNMERSDDDLRRELKRIVGIGETAAPPRVASSPPASAIEAPGRG